MCPLPCSFPLFHPPIECGTDLIVHVINVGNVSNFDHVNECCKIVNIVVDVIASAIIIAFDVITITSVIAIIIIEKLSTHYSIQK